VAKQAEVEPEEDFGARKPEYIDVIVSDVRTKNGFNFSVQILNTEGKILRVSSLLNLTLT
jgi:staphylococcal nuclease domain-containing protein 1